MHRIWHVIKILKEADNKCDTVRLLLKITIKKSYPVHNICSQNLLNLETFYILNFKLKKCVLLSYFPIDKYFKYPSKNEWKCKNLLTCHSFLKVKLFTDCSILNPEGWCKKKPNSWQSFRHILCCTLIPFIYTQVTSIQVPPDRTKWCEWSEIPIPLNWRSCHL